MNPATLTCWGYYRILVGGTTGCLLGVLPDFRHESFFLPLLIFSTMAAHINTMLHFLLYIVYYVLF